MGLHGDGKTERRGKRLMRRSWRKSWWTGREATAYEGGVYDDKTTTTRMRSESLINDDNDEHDSFDGDDKKFTAAS